MDVDISRWILEFFFRQSVGDRFLAALISVLPTLPDDDLILKKIMLLRGLQSEIAAGSVSNRMLELMEQIEELHYRDGVIIPESMKAAYCAVAVNCTLRVLESDGGDNFTNYFEAVKNIWKRRVCKMERADMAGLVSEELRCWANEIEEAVWDNCVWEKLLLRSKENDPLELVRVYVLEAFENMGPSFIDSLADLLSGHNELREVLDLLINSVCDPVIESVPCFSNPPHDAAVNSKNEDKTKKYELPLQNHVASKHVDKSIAGTSRGVRVTDNEELGVDLFDKYKFPHTPEIEKVQEALKSSTMELKSVVQNPLPDAISIADAIVANMEREEENVDAPNLPDDRRYDIHDNDGGGRMNPMSGPTQSLMRPNGTARTYEWDSDDDLTEVGSPSERDRPRLPTPKRMAASPLKKYKIVKLMKRRKRKKWSNLEEDTLRIGVQKYGKGNWKLILNMYPDIFEERTEVDLKDKWRNMIRYGLTH